MHLASHILLIKTQYFTFEGNNNALSQTGQITKNQTRITLLKVNQVKYAFKFTRRATTFVKKG